MISSPSAEDAFGELHGEDYPTQRLYRVQAMGPGRDGSLRLVARVANPQRYQITASDVFGRLLWDVGTEASTARVLDHRQRRACELPQGELTLEGFGVGVIEGPAVIRLLLGRLPVPLLLDRGDEAAQERLDGLGRRWTVSLVDGELDRWTLWGDLGPRVWWQRESSGGYILSTRDGSQLRWRETAKEVLTATLEPLSVPSDYSEGACGELGFL